MTVTDVRRDPQSRTMTLDAEFDASADRVWQLWTDPRQLERWWGPPTYPATFTRHDLAPGSRVRGRALVPGAVLAGERNCCDERSIPGGGGGDLQARGTPRALPETRDRRRRRAHQGSRPCGTRGTAAVSFRRTGRYYDIVMMSDLRLMGGPGPSMAEEIRAQHMHGYTTAVLPLQTTILNSARPIHPGVREAIDLGMADLVLPDQPLEARLCMLRLPAAFRQPPPLPFAVTARQVLLVANSAPAEPDATKAYYDAEAVHRVVTEQLGREPIWAPIGPLVRNALLAATPDLPLAERDWVNILDVERWQPRLVGRLAQPQLWCLQRLGGRGEGVAD